MMKHRNYLLLINTVYCLVFYKTSEPFTSNKMQWKKSRTKKITTGLLVSGMAITLKKIQGVPPSSIFIEFFVPCVGQNA